MGKNEPKIKNLEKEPRRFYAVGDIHGCNKQLKQMLEKIVEHGFSDEDVLIFLGDYVDRGPDSKDCIQQILDFKKDRNNVYCLMGNHEDMMVSYLGWAESEFGRYFMNNGGNATAKSYIPLSDSFVSLEDKEKWLAEFPEEHKDFLCNLYHVISTEKFYFVHANADLQILGNDPTKWRLEKIIWDRHWQFFKHELGKTIVHGHTPVSAVTFYNSNFSHKKKNPFGGPDEVVEPKNGQYYHSIDVDTGCVFGDYYGQCLSCVVLDNNLNYEVISVKSDVDF
jgi:serine/threonine protein phosphatase 1